MPTPDLTTLPDYDLDGLTVDELSALLAAPAPTLGFFDLLGLGRKFGVAPVGPAGVGDEHVYPRPAAVAGSYARPAGTDAGTTYRRVT